MFTTLASFNQKKAESHSRYLAPGRRADNLNFYGAKSTNIISYKKRKYVFFLFFLTYLIKFFVILHRLKFIDYGKRFVF